MMTICRIEESSGLVATPGAKSLVVHGEYKDIQVTACTAIHFTGSFSTGPEVVVIHVFFFFLSVFIAIQG